MVKKLEGTYWDRAVALSKNHHCDDDCGLPYEIKEELERAHAAGKEEFDLILAANELLAHSSIQAEEQLILAKRALRKIMIVGAVPRGTSWDIKPTYMHQFYAAKAIKEIEDVDRNKE